ncbi:unnamed protein product [Cyclocybe aegerita]|uniref:NAD(P)-binding protein n=1 Tax=Cyclocybe aegerita TaxID=1973307 RepID=A0A8S0XT20_CYCAE|nr:unnamed protein product [Cyclocybe aegerita]
MSATKVYLVTGANRGIGLGLVHELATRHKDVVVYAGVRDTANASSLQELSTKFPGKIEIVPFVAGDEAINQALAKTIQDRHGYLDVVIGNAGTIEYMGNADETPIDIFRKHLEVNTTGVLVLFQALASLLKASKSTPKFIPISSGAGSLTALIHAPLGFTAYGASKAAMNFLTRKIHYENEWLVAFPLAPGLVNTDMGSKVRVMDKTGIMANLQDEMMMSVEEASVALVNLVDNSTREKQGGEFLKVDGETVPW